MKAHQRAAARKLLDKLYRNKDVQLTVYGNTGAPQSRNHTSHEEARIAKACDEIRAENAKVNYDFVDGLINDFLDVVIR